MTDFAINAAFTLLERLVGLLPVFVMDFSDLCALPDYLGWIACMIDMVAIRAVLTLIVPVEGMLLAVRGVVWLWDRLPLT